MKVASSFILPPSAFMITAVVMVGESGGESEPVAWVQAARRAAAADLLAQLASQSLIERIILVTPEAEGLPTAVISHLVTTPPGPVHVGRQLAQLVKQFQIERLLYLGGASAPLLSNELLTGIVGQLATADGAILTNNRFASDWAAITPAYKVIEWRERLPKDNMLGWVLSTEAGLTGQAQPATAATRLDIDTPTDLLTLRLHPHTKLHLRRCLAGLPLDTGRLERALAVLARPASRVFIAGRLGPEVWLALNRATQAWLRVISEERGLVSSGRQERGEARSFVAEFIEAAGMERFFTLLAEWADAAFMDTRVLMAHGGRPQPDQTSRFASDLGQPEWIEEPRLRDFTRLASAAPIPIVLGGHSLVAGDMLAFCEIMNRTSLPCRARPSPS